MVTVCAPARPTWRPNRPATMAPTRGAKAARRYAVFMSSALQAVERLGIDRIEVAEQQDQDREADRRLGGRDREDEEHEDLAGRVAEEVREGDEVQVDREQHQLDG